MCKTNGNAYKAEIDNQKKLIEILNKNIDFNNLIKIMFDIYFNKDIKDGHKISYKSNTDDYNQFLYKNLKRSIQFANNFISKLSSFLYNDFTYRTLSEEKINQIIDKITEIRNINYWKNLNINEVDFETYVKYHNIKFSINNDIELNVYKFLFSFAPDCGKQYGKGEFLRCYASHLSPNLMEKGDCMIRTNAVAELKNANKNEYGNLMFNRHNYYTANGNSNEILLIFLKISYIILFQLYFAQMILLNIHLLKI